MRLLLHTFNVVFIAVVSFCDIEKCNAGRSSHCPCDDIDPTGSDVGFLLPEWCSNPSGSDCRWYRDCLAVTFLCTFIDYRNSNFPSDHKDDDNGCGGGGSGVGGVAFVISLASRHR